MTTIGSNPKFLDAVLELPGLEGAKDVPTPSVRAHKKQLMTGELTEPSETSVLTVCWWSTPLHARQGRRYEVSILGSMLGKPNQSSMVALKCMARYLKGTRDFVNKLELDNEVEIHVAGPDGLSDSDWARLVDRKSQSSGALFVDGSPLYALS